MTVLVWLILAHVVGSFYLYRRADVHSAVRNTSNLTRVVCSYVLIIAVTMFALIALDQLGGSWRVVVAWLALAVVFGLTRLINPHKALAILLEHIISLLIVVVIWAWLTGFTPFVLAWSYGLLLQRELLIAVVLYLLAARPASLFIAALLRSQSEQLQGHSQGLAEAGRMIGYVERWLVLSFVLGGQFAGIGFLLAAKSIFRFGDLSQAHERKLTEYMLLGTLSSFASAILLGALGRYLIG